MPEVGEIESIDTIRARGRRTAEQQCVIYPGSRPSAGGHRADGGTVVVFAEGQKGEVGQDVSREDRF